ncbi:transcriptional regulator family: Fungal Specific TF [Paecilomyces variotii]|nr:transcriptional regulator family: Fungal Specific TF [Paecilomyces variotii]KAJ9238223.1 transcriptional regulator family: Fungal Specific TF [Paecilomyces variotii]
MAPWERRATNSNGSDGPRGSPEGSQQVKNRPSPSCIPCRRRKVKCDRMKPCRACCSKDTPEACQYNTNSEDRFYISQAEIIEILRNEVNRLRNRLAILERETQSDLSVTVSESDCASSGNPAVVQDTVRGSSVPRSATKYAALENMYALLASAPPDLVEDVITQVREGISVEAVAARVTSMDYALVRGRSV